MTKALWKASIDFFDKMISKLMHQAQTHGYSGWDFVSEDYLMGKLMRNIEKKDWVDVANLSMMLYRRQKNGDYKL